MTTTKKATATKAVPKKTTKKTAAKETTTDKTDAMLAALRKARRKGATVAELVAATGQTGNAIQIRCYRLSRAGKLVVVDGSRPRRYKIAPRKKA